MLEFLAYVIPILIILSLIVTFHELGHFTVARLFKTRVERFSVGFGKILLRHKDKNGVEWCLSALPLGGYVKFAGDENISSMMPSVEDLEASRALITEREGAAAVNDYFHFKPLWQRFLIILAGPVANFVLAIVIFAILFQIVGKQYYVPTIDHALPGSAAEAAGFRPGDTITRIDGHAVEGIDDVSQLIILRANSTIKIDVLRDGAQTTLIATPVRTMVTLPNGHDKMSGGFLGVEFKKVAVKEPVNPLQAVGMGASYTWQILDTNLTYIGRIFTGKENASQIGGIVGMAKTTGDQTVAVAASTESPLVKIINMVFSYVQIMAGISISVGFVNLLPIPILDGGHLVFYAYQSVTKKAIPAGIQNAAFRIAVVLVLGLMLFAFWNDANRIGLVHFLGKMFS